MALINLLEGAAAATPATGNVTLYAKADGNLYQKDDTGTETQLGVSGGTGTVTSVSVVSANGMGGTVATATTTPAITLSTSITGVLKGNGTAISAAVNSDLPSMSSTVGGAVPTPPNNTTTFLRGDGVFATPSSSGDMVLSGIQSVTGAKTFLDTKLLMRNVANTFNGSFTNSNTADRVYTLKDAAGTVAFVTDITGTNSGTNTGDQTAATVPNAPAGNIAATTVQAAINELDTEKLAASATALNGTTIPASKTLVVTTDLGVSVQAYDANTAKLNIKQSWTKPQRPNYLNTDAVSTTSSYTYDGDTKGQINLITLTNAITVTFAAPTTIVEGSPYTFMLKAGDTSARTFAWNTAFQNSPPTTGTIISGKCDVLNFIGGASNVLIFNGYSAGV